MSFANLLLNRQPKTAEWHLETKLKLGRLELYGEIWTNHSFLYVSLTLFPLLVSCRWLDWGLQTGSGRCTFGIDQLLYAVLWLQTYTRGQLINAKSQFDTLNAQAHFASTEFSFSTQALWVERRFDKSKTLKSWEKWQRNLMRWPAGRLMMEEHQVVSGSLTPHIYFPFWYDLGQRQLSISSVTTPVEEIQGKLLRFHWLSGASVSVQRHLWRVHGGLGHLAAHRPVWLPGQSVQINKHSRWSVSCFKMSRLSLLSCVSCCHSLNCFHQPWR